MLGPTQLAILISVECSGAPSYYGQHRIGKSKHYIASHHVCIYM